MAKRIRFNLSINEELLKYIKIKAVEEECTVSELIHSMFYSGLFYEEMLKEVAEVEDLKESYFHTLNKKIYGEDYNKLQCYLT